MELELLMQSMELLKRCKKFEYVDGVPTLTVDPGMYYEILSCIAEANLCVVGNHRGIDFAPTVSVCGVILVMKGA